MKNIQFYNTSLCFMTLCLVAITTSMSCKVNQDLVSNTSHIIEERFEQKVISNFNKKVNSLTDEELKIWAHMDYETDTIPGISLNKLYDSGLLDILNHNKKIVVAVLDTKLPIDHEDLLDQIWRNKDEIADNNIDDDNNGYVDDINGWDFLSNSKGEYIKFQHFEIVRIINKYIDVFEKIEPTKIQPDQVETYALFKKAKQEYKELKSSITGTQTYLGDLLDNYSQADQVFKKLLPNQDYTISTIDSILNQTQDSTIIANGEDIKFTLRNFNGVEKLKSYDEMYKGYVNASLKFEYDERSLIGDDPDNIEDHIYGSPFVYGDVPFEHSVAVCGILGANRSNNIGLKGFSDNIEIMPVVMVSTGDETDKDVALAIRYAVDNGAKIINMSWGRSFSSNEEWIVKAIKYASAHDVLLIHGSGNDGKSNDINNYYPNDHKSGIEYVDNFY